MQIAAWPKTHLTTTEKEIEMTKLTKATRAAIIKTIDDNTDYDAATVQFHRDGSISAIEDADKTFNGPHFTRLLVGYVSDFANGANPFIA